MKIADFEKRLENAVLVADGAMGSVLFEAAGVQRCFEELNISQPEAVFRVHQAYIQAGAQIIETNTFGANRAKLAALGLADQVAAFNHRGVKIAREAREAAPHEVLIAGSMGPLGMGAGDRPSCRAKKFWRFTANRRWRWKSAAWTCFCWRRSRTSSCCWRRSMRSGRFPALPVVAQLTFSEEGTTHDGTRPAEAAARLAAKNVQAIGSELHPRTAIAFAGARGTGVGGTSHFGDAQCGVSETRRAIAPFTRDLRLNILRCLRARLRPSGARIRGRLLRHLSRAYSRACGRGAGTAARNARGKSRVRRPAPATPAKHIAAKREPESGVWRKLQAHEFVLSVEIDPPKGIALDRVFEQVDKVMATGCVDAIDINSGTLARVGMDAMMVAGALEARGVETIPHLTTQRPEPDRIAGHAAGRLVGGRRAQSFGDYRRSAVAGRSSGDERSLRNRFDWTGESCRAA